jgi:hypothetical protein
MEAGGRAIFEEQILHILISDLARAARARLPRARSR